jgi:UrcA family protein
MKMVLVIAAILASSMLVVPTVAQANTQELEQVSTTVRYRSGESATQFQQRLTSKARRMCAEGRSSNLALRADTERCVADALRAVR